MSVLRRSTIRLWLALTAVLLSAVVSAPVAASNCAPTEDAPSTRTKASCEMAACCCGESLQSTHHAHTQAPNGALQSSGCDCSLQQAPAPSESSEVSARAFTQAFGLPVAPALIAVDVIRGPCASSARDPHPRDGSGFRKPSRAPPADRR